MDDFNFDLEELADMPPEEQQKKINALLNSLPPEETHMLLYLLLHIDFCREAAKEAYPELEWDKIDAAFSSNAS